MFKVIRFTAIISLFALCQLASAQTYSIRVEFNTNLRAQPGLDSQVLNSAPAGAILQVVGSFNRWLKINRNGFEVWMARWVNHSRVDASAPAASPAATSSTPVDNCCGIDRQCQTDQDWTDGYWAFQHGQCAAPARTQSSTQPIPVSASIAVSSADNCCQLGWQCSSDQEWQDGYWAFRNNECSAPVGIDNCCQAGWQCQTEQDWDFGWAAYKYYQCSDDIPMRIDGSPTFVNLVREAYNRLKQSSPRLYHYGVTGFSRIIEGPADDGTGYSPDSNTMVQAFGRGSYNEYDVLVVVGGIAHEACHGHQVRAGTSHPVGWRNELPCMQKELESYQAVDPPDKYGLIAWAQDIIDNISNPEYWWW